MSKFVELKLAGQTLAINPRGGGIAEYYVEMKGVRHDIIYGYSREEDYDGGMGDILSPFPGRVENSTFDFDGESYQLSGFSQNKGNTIHAFVREMLWQVKKSSENQITSTLDVSSEEMAGHGYPFSLKYEVKYTLLEKGLSVETSVENTGSKTAPFGIGYHPYFKVAAQVDEMVWRVPAKKVVEFDATLKPTGKLINIGETRLDFRTAKAIEGIEIDNCFTDLRRDESGIFTSTLQNLTGTKIINIWQDKSYPYFQTYSADTIADRNYRQAMALEPQTCCGYAVNVLGLGLIALKPQEKFSGRWGVNYKFKN